MLQTHAIGNAGDAYGKSHGKWGMPNARDICHCNQYNLCRMRPGYTLGIALLSTGFAQVWSLLRRLGGGLPDLGFRDLQETWILLGSADSFGKKVFFLLRVFFCCACFLFCVFFLLFEVPFV